MGTHTLLKIIQKYSMQLKTSVFAAAVGQSEQFSGEYFIKNAYANKKLSVSGPGNYWSSDTMIMNDYTAPFCPTQVFELEMHPDGKHVRIASKQYSPTLYLTVRTSGVPTFTTWAGYDDQWFELIQTGVAGRYIITMKFKGEGGNLSLGWNPSQGGWFARPVTIYDDMKWYILPKIN